MKIKTQFYIWLLCVLILCMVLLISHCMINFENHRSVEEQIAIFINKNINQEDFELVLFDVDNFEEYGIIGFQENNSNNLGIAIFDRIDESSQQLVECYFSDRMTERGLDIFITHGVSNYFIVLSNNPEFAEIVIKYGNIIYKYEIHSVPSLNIIHIPTGISTYSYDFYDRFGNIIST